MPSTLINRILPEYDFRTRHSIRVRASQRQTFSALMSCNFAADPVVRALMRLRGFKSSELRAGDYGFRDNLRRGGFLELALAPDEEWVIGIAGKFWHLDGGRAPLRTAREFQEFRTEGYAKAVWNFTLLAESPNVTSLYTETRVQTLGPAARRRFAMYWFMVHPFSGLIRTAMLRQVKRRAESDTAMAQSA
jgi:hypothetical protein